jgi:hypothetical protein
MGVPSRHTVPLVVELEHHGLELVELVPITAGKVKHGW